MISHHKEAGSATVEFIGLALILLIPAVYLLVTLAQLQAAGYAVVAAADQAAKTVGFAEDDLHAEYLATNVIHLTAENFQLDPAKTSMQVHCTQDSCVEPGTFISVEVSIDVPMPLMNTIFGQETRIATLKSTGYHLIGEFE